VERQPNYTVELWGPPRTICYDKDNNPARPLFGFCKNNSINTEDIEFKSKKGREFAYFSKEVEGKNSIDILKNGIGELISLLPFKRKMRLDNEQFYTRPIRGIIFLKENELIPYEIFNIRSSNVTYSNHFTKKIIIDNAQNYESLLEKNGVIISEEKRLSNIKKGFSDIEAMGYSIEIDEYKKFFLSYLDENPVILFGDFSKVFLKLPEEIIKNTLWIHQKCLSIKKNGEITNHYITVISATSSQKLVKDNYENVISARMADADFFYDLDIKTPIEKFIAKLDNVIYFDKWGSLKRLVEYIESLSVILSKQLGFDPEIAKKAGHYSKFDLVTNIVSEKEYTSLQGVMGCYYLKNANIDEKIAYAVRDQYLPIGENDRLPETPYGGILAIINKLILITITHSLDLNISGSKDIYGVRRASLGIYKIVLKFGFSFDLFSILEQIDFLNKKNRENIYDFIIDRIKAYERDVNGINGEIINAATDYRERDLLILKKKITALAGFSKEKDFNSTKITLKRVLNILDGKNNYDFSRDLIREEATLILYEKYLLFENETVKNWGNFDLIFVEILKLKKYIDNFFDNVMVNVNDKILMENRKGLLNLIGNKLLKVANFKIIS
jgi:glycyl-tRNA synthetase beta chain